MGTDRTAIIVVHGIPDRQPGRTVREVTRLPCHGGDGEPRYVHAEMQDQLIPVQKLEPAAALPRSCSSWRRPCSCCCRR